MLVIFNRDNIKIVLYDGSSRKQIKIRGYDICIRVLKISKLGSKGLVWKSINVSQQLSCFWGDAISCIKHVRVLLGVVWVNIRGFCYRSDIRPGDILNLQYFIKKWNKVQFNLIKLIKSQVWPHINKLYYLLINDLIEFICYLSQIGENMEAMLFIEDYSFSPLVRCLAINKVLDNVNIISKKELLFISKNHYKLYLYRQTSFLKCKNLYLALDTINVLTLSSSKGIQKIRVINTFDRVLQTQLCILLDAYYEAKFNESQYGFRLGRNSLQALGFFRRVIDNTDKTRLGFAFLDIQKCFYEIPHNILINLFKVPFKWVGFLQKWLKVTLWSNVGDYLGILQKGVVLGSVIGRLICNVIILHSIYKNKITNKRLLIFDNLLKIFKGVNGDWFKKVYTIITYAGLVVLITNYCLELELLILLVKNALLGVGLLVENSNIQLIKYNNYKKFKVKFDFLGFTFFFVPINYLSLGGIVKKNVSVTNLKSMHDFGSHLVYPSKKSFQSIKNMCTEVITSLKHKTLIEVLIKINLIIRGWVYYFCWSMAFSRLTFLEHFIYKKFKKALVSKFKFRGVKRVLWVVKNFFLCGAFKYKNSGIISPLKARWHLHCKLPSTFINFKYGSNFCFLASFTKILKSIPITYCYLPFYLRKNPYYLYKSEFQKFHLNLWVLRSFFKQNYKQWLFIKQNGVCFKCKLFLETPTIRYWVPKLGLFKIYFIVPSVGYTKLQRKLVFSFKNINNMVLLHKECYNEIINYSITLESPMLRNKLVGFGGSEKFLNINIIY